MELNMYLFKSIVILTLFYLVYFIFLRKDTLFTAKRHFLLSGIVAALALPFLEFTKTIYKEAPVFNGAMASNYSFVNTPLEAPSETILMVDWWQVALSVYVIGAVIMGIRLVLQFLSLRKLIRTYPSEKQEKYTFVKVDEAIAPFSFFRYIVFNPTSHSEEELHMILKHEEVHVSQWHSLDIIVANLARILQWINPFSWLYKKSLEENLEFIADNETVARIPSKKEYQLTLVKSSSSLYAPAITTQFYQSFIKKRIIMLNKNMSNRRNIWKLSIVLPALALFLWSFSVTEVVEYKEVVAQEVNTLEDASNLDQTTVESKLAAITENLPENKETTQNIAATEESPFVNDLEEVAMLEEIDLYPLATNSTTVERSLAVAKAIKFRITKNTTDKELEIMKRELKTEHDIDMSYTVVRNSNGEIKAISLSYTGNGSNGSYNIEEDDAIEPFEFFMDEDGYSGFWSEGAEIRKMDRIKRHLERIEERNEEREERMERRLEESEGRRARMEERREEVEERREIMEEREEVLQKEMEDREEVMEERAYAMAKQLKEDKKRVEKESRGIARRNKELAERAYLRARDRERTVARGSSRSGNVYSYGDSSSSENAILIDKNTTDATLELMKTKLAARGVTFNYSKVKRNANGEIVRIKITTNDGKGSKSTISSQTDDGAPIEDILIEI